MRSQSVTCMLRAQAPEDQGQRSYWIGPVTGWSPFIQPEARIYTVAVIIGKPRWCTHSASAKGIHSN